MFSTWYNAVLQAYSALIPFIESLILRRGSEGE
jgi:hypothetical protein